MRTSLLTALALGAILAAACGQDVSDAYLKYAGQTWNASNFETLRPGDKFSITVFRQAELTMSIEVPQSGVVKYPLIGEVAVGGRHCADVEVEITMRLASGYIVDPLVSCRVDEKASLRVSVVGQVKSPGTFPYRANLTLVEAIAIAQGVSESAAEDRAIVTRVVDGETVNIEVPLGLIMSGRAPNFPLWPDDTVFVPSYRLIP